jgi:hypothetical protein
MKMDRRGFLKLSCGSVVAASLVDWGASFTYAKEAEDLNLPKPSVKLLKGGHCRCWMVWIDHC